MYGLGIGTFPLGLTGLYSEHGDKLTVKEFEDKIAAWIKDSDPRLLAYLYFTLNRGGLTLSDCPAKIAALKKELRP